jgi:hypothetical protein
MNKKTGEEYDFFIWKDGKMLKFDVEEARQLFPKAVERHERSISRHLIYCD